MLALNIIKRNIKVDASYNSLLLYCEPVLHDVNSVLNRPHRVVTHKLGPLYPLFDKAWTTCQQVTQTLFLAFCILFFNYAFLNLTYILTFIGPFFSFSQIAIEYRW